MCVQELGPVLYRPRVEDYYVGDQTFAQQTPIGDAEMLGMLAAHLVDGLRQGQYPLFTHVFGQHAWEGAVAARMGLDASVRLQTRVRADADQRMGQYAAQVVFGHNHLDGRHATHLFQTDANIQQVRSPLRSKLSSSLALDFGPRFAHGTEQKLLGPAIAFVQLIHFFGDHVHYVRIAEVVPTAALLFDLVRDARNSVG